MQSHNTRAALADLSNELESLKPSESGKAGESCGFAPGADAISCKNAARGESDVLLLVGDRLREPVAMGGPIVMNYDWEIDEAYRELQAGTFLKRTKRT